MSERWLWTQKEDIGPSPRYGPAMAYEAARQRVVLFGGLGLISLPHFNDTWEWDGGAWTQVADMGPSGRQYSSMAYDDSRQRLVLFGGLGREIGGTGGDVANGETWEWNGTEWTQVADVGPVPRGGCAMTYDTVRQRVVLFGGSNAGGTIRFGDTWEWDGTEWTQTADTGPSGRRFPALVFDGSRGSLVLFGGLGETQWHEDTWEWVADTGWVERQDMGPRGILTPTMAYTTQHTVLFGSHRLGGAAGQTWEWDGRLWTQRQDMGPPSRAFHAFTHDSQRDRVVLFGGWSYELSDPLGDTWELAIIEQ
jgi:hypothetical protein